MCVCVCAYVCVCVCVCVSDVVPSLASRRVTETGTHTFTNAQISEHYSMCVKLSAENVRTLHYVTDMFRDI